MTPQPSSNAPGASIHASAVLIGALGILIRGPSGAGKSTLVWQIISGAHDAATFVRLIADDRVVLSVSGNRVLARPVEALAGRIEIRGLGIRRLIHEPAGVIGLVVDLGDPDAGRLPDGAAMTTTLAGVQLPRLCAPGPDVACRLIRAWLTSLPDQD